MNTQNKSEWEKEVSNSARLSGKTTLAVNEFINKCKQGKKVVFKGKDFICMDTESYKSLLKQAIGRAFELQSAIESDKRSHPKDAKTVFEMAKEELRIKKAFYKEYGITD